ncbi:MAG: ABC transporter substrate-binding protein [Planctomycetota bacterium]|nr:ABC transporter substrate-binding protein [Planctomycetota bacterium]
MRKPHLFLLATVAVAAAAFVYDRPRHSAKSAAASGTGPVLFPARSDREEEIELTYWEKWTGFEGEAMKATVAAFNRKRVRNAAGRIIRVNLLTTSQIDRKAMLAIAGANPPDLIGLFSYNIHVFAGKGALMELDGYLRRYGIREEDYIPCYWRLCRYKGSMVCLPTTPATIALYWNKDHFAEVRLDPERPPGTLRELDEYAERLTVRDGGGRYVRLGFLPPEPGWWNWGWSLWFGGRLTDDEGRITADRPENVAALEWVQSYSKKYGTKGLQSFRGEFGPFQSPQNAFFSGRVSMVLQGVWFANFIRRFAPKMFEEDRWGCAPFPSAVPGLENVTIAEADVIAIPVGAPHPDEAFEFIRFVNSREGMELLCTLQGKHTPFKEVSREFLENHPHPKIGLFIELAKSPNAWTTPQTPLWLEYRLALSAAFDRVWLLKASPAEALRDVQREMEARDAAERAREARRAGTGADRRGR